MAKQLTVTTNAIKYVVDSVIQFKMAGITTLEADAARSMYIFGNSSTTKKILYSDIGEIKYGAGLFAAPAGFTTEMDAIATLIV